MLTVGNSPASAPAAAGPARRLARDVWAVADQALISGTNFVTMILVARSLGPAGFGTFTLVYSALLFSNMLQTALVTQPHNVLGTARSGRDYAAYTTSTLYAQVLLVLLEAVLAIAAWSAAGQLGWAGAPLLLALAPSIVAWQLQEFIRRVLYTEGRHRAAFANDMISYGVQTLAVAVMWLSDTLTGVTALYALAATSALATIVGLWQIRHSLVRGANLDAIPINGHFGKWLAGAEVVNWSSSLNMYLYLAAAMLGTVATGELKAAQVLFGPTRVLAYYLDTVLPIRFARRLAAAGEEAVRVQLRSVLARVAMPLAAYCLLVALVARPLLHVTFGAGYEGAAIVLGLYSAYAFLTYLQMIIAAALKARRATHLIFAGSACGLLVSLPASLLLIPHLMTVGILAAMIAGALVVTTLFLYACCRPTGSELRAAMVAVVVAGGKEEPCPS